MDEDERLIAEAHFLRHLLWSGGCTQLKAAPEIHTSPQAAQPPSAPAAKLSMQSLLQRLKSTLLFRRHSAAGRAASPKPAAGPAEVDVEESKAARVVDLLKGRRRDLGLILQNLDLLLQCSAHASTHLHSIVQHQLSREGLVGPAGAGESESRDVPAAVNCLSAAKSVLELLMLLVETQRQGPQGAAANFSTPMRLKRQSVDRSPPAHPREVPPRTAIGQLVRVCYSKYSVEFFQSAELTLVGRLFARVSQLITERNILPRASQCVVVEDRAAVAMVEEYVTECIGSVAPHGVAHPLRRALCAFVRRHDATLSALWESLLRLDPAPHDATPAVSLAAEYEAERSQLIAVCAEEFFVQTFSSRQLPIFVQAEESSQSAVAQQQQQQGASTEFTRKFCLRRPTPLLLDFSALRYRSLPLLLEDTLEQFVTAHFFTASPVARNIDGRFLQKCGGNVGRLSIGGLAAAAAAEAEAEVGRPASEAPSTAELLLDRGRPSATRLKLFQAAVEMLRCDFSEQSFSNDVRQMCLRRDGDHQQLAELKIKQLTHAFRLVELTAAYHSSFLAGDDSPRGGNVPPHCTPDVPAEQDGASSSPDLFCCCCGGGDGVRVRSSTGGGVGADEVFPLLLEAVAEAAPEKLCSFLAWTRVLRNQTEPQDDAGTAALTGGFVFLVGGAEAYLLATYAAVCEAVATLR